MPASAEKIFEVGMPFEQTVNLVKQILPEISAVIDQADDQKGTFVAKKDRSAKSFGELIRVEIETVPDQGCRIRVNSTSTSETTVNDLGVNDENIAAFERSLALHLSPPAPAPTQPNVTDLSSLLTPQTAQSIPASSYVPQAMPTSNYYPPRPTKDRSVALLLEIVLGLFGFLGTGWIYGGNTNKGILWLGGMLAWDVVAAVIIVATAGFGCLCTLPISIGLIALSASTLSAYTKEHPELFNP